MSDEINKTRGLAVTMTPKTWWGRFLCFIGWHHWVNKDPGSRQGACIGTWLGPQEWQQCDRCGVEEDPRCEECQGSYTGACLDRHRREYREQQLRENCCIHCPKEPHQHSCH